MNRRTALAAAALVAAALLWSGGTVLVRGLRESIPPMGLTFWRSVAAFAIVLPFAIRPIAAEWRLARTEWPRLATAGPTGVALFPIVLFEAVHNTEAINIGLISAAEPLVIALVAWAALGHRLGAAQGIGFAVGAAGVAVIATEGEPARLAELSIGAGDGFAILSLYVWAVYTVLIQRLPRALGAAQVLAAVFGWGIVFGAPFALIEGLVDPVVPSLPAATVVLYSAACGAVLAFAFWNFGAGVLGPGRAGFFLYLIPVFILALAVVVLDEPPRAYHGVGAVAIGAGIAVATVPWRRRGLTDPARGPKRRHRLAADDEGAS